MPLSLWGPEAEMFLLDCFEFLVPSLWHYFEGSEDFGKWVTEVRPWGYLMPGPFHLTLCFLFAMM
jgi:hypothetical protein